MSAPQPAAVQSMRKAGTLLLLRDRDVTMQVLMLRRVERAGDRASGAWVFPGGTVDAQDGAAHALCAGLDDAQASRRLGLPAGGLDLYITALRECFEESGLLLATGPDGALLTDAALPESPQERSSDLASLLGRLRAQLAADRLVYMAHWITPVELPKRFDTRFFAARAPEGQSVVCAQDEVCAHAWISPREALEREGDFPMMRVTRRVLASVAGFRRVQDCLDHFTSIPQIPVVQPSRAAPAPGVRAVIDPSDAARAEPGLAPVAPFPTDPRRP